MKVPTKTLAVLGVAGIAALGLTSCEGLNTVARSTSPVVLTGAELPGLVGQQPGSIVAFRYSPLGGTPTWTQIPVQVDERKVVDFGAQPANNTTAGVVGTVYGNGTSGVTALQYADPNTFVGADSNPAFDADDELVFMASDMGGRLGADVSARPAGTVAGSGVAVQITDPRGTGSPAERGWAYLFVTSGSLSPGAGQDYVDYDFNLTSGAYASTYKRAAGTNPETSRVITPTYEARFSDRWKEDAWLVRSPGASGVDVLDGYKNQFAINSCGRSNQTFAEGEGAFAANIDGPVRAIRSYIGANSGPLTQRTHLMYRDREDVVTDLRVHAIPSIMDFLDLSAAATGMTYRSSTLPSGVTVDGTNDSVPAGLAAWEVYDGAPGNVMTHTRVTTDVSPYTAVQFYRDQTAPPEAQCWGDPSLLGAAGSSAGAVPNTDPRAAGFSSLSLTRVTQFGAPAATPADIPATAADWATDLETPLTAVVGTVAP